MDKRPQILIVDDDATLLRATARALSLAGYTTWEARSGKEGYQMARTHRPDLVVMDVVMPDGDGLAWCKRIKDTPELEGIYVVLISGMRSGGPDRDAGLQAGADGYLSRPITNDALLAYITSLVQLQAAERSLRRERDFFQHVMETSPVAITVLNTEGVITLANTQAEKVLGLSRTEVEGRSYNAPEWQIAKLDGTPLADEEYPFRRVIITERPVYDVRHLIRWPNGRVVFLSINGAPLADSGGEVDRVVFAIADITAEVKAQRALEASRAQLRTLFDSIADSVFIHDKDYRILEVNASACARLGYDKDELKGMTMLDIEQNTPANEGTSPTPAYAGLISGAQQELTQERRHRRRDGRIIPVEIVSRATEMMGQKVIVSTARDISERLAHREQRAKEMNSLTAMSGEPMRGATAAAFRLKTLKHGAPDLFRVLTSEYTALIKLAVERRITDVEHDVSQTIRSLSDRLGRLGTGPRDVVDLHIAAVKEIEETIPPQKREVTVAEGRLIMIELMGHLITYYRQRAYLPGTGHLAIADELQSGGKRDEP